MPRDPNCIFCKIVAGEVPSHGVFENEAVMAFLDVGPLADGHLLVIPREHHSDLLQMSAEQCAQLGAVLPRLAKALMEVTQAEGFNVLQNNGKAAGQAVDHVHFHLIPRRADDNLGYRWNAGSYPDDRADELVSAFRCAIAHVAE